MENDPSEYICIEAPTSGAFKISDFVGSNPGDLPPGGGVVSVIIDGNLIVDIDYSFDPGSHVLLTSNSSISVTDQLAVPNQNSPKLIFDGTIISSCGNDRWSFISATDEFSEISFINGTIAKQGTSCIFIGENAALTATNSTFSDISISCITLGSTAGPYAQNVNATIVNNVFEFSPFGVRVFHTQSISIGTGNIFRFPVAAPPSFGNPVAILSSSSSISVASGNAIEGFPIGIWSNNKSADFRYLSCSGIEISDCGTGIDIRALNDGTSSPQDGVNLYLRSSLFKNNTTDISADAQSGNSYWIFGNQFLNQQGNNTSSIAIGGTIPQSISFQNNIIDRPAGNGIRLSLPVWDAGASGLNVQNNDITTNIDGIGLSLFRGGRIGDNIVTCSGNTAIEIVNCDGASIYDNEVSATGTGDGQFSGSIYLENSVNCILECNYTDGMGNGGGISFFEHCDNSIVLRNTMSNHVRGLASVAFAGDPVIGQQPYRDNIWLGGSTAEAALETFSGTVLPFFFIASQFTVQNNTGQIWPAPIIPSQNPLGADPLAWFRVVSSPSNPPQACFDTPPIEEVFGNLTRFEEGLMDGTVNPPVGSSGKYRDIDFQVFSKLKSDLSPLDINSYAYYESLNSSYFNDRYSLQEHIMHASDASATLDIEEENELLLEKLELLASIDDGTQESLRDSTLESVHSLSSLISGPVLSYQEGMEERLSNIQLLLQGMSGTAPSDSAFVEVATVYFNNFGMVYEQYSQADQSVVDYYAGLCALEYEEAVYLANAIAGTAFKYDLISACTTENLFFQVPDKPQTNERFRIYPSPTRGEINIHYPFEEFESMKVYNAIGKVILELKSPQQTINLNGEATGIYFVELISQNNERYVQKVILQ